MSVDRRRFGLGLCGCATLALLPELGRAADTPLQFVPPHYRPTEDGDERGLWSMTDRAERELSTSRFVIRDADVHEYVVGIVCRLGKDYCDDVRSYVVRTPLFNASMAPNGMLQVWSGLLLRCRDEAQLAGIIGHEFGHYLRRHTVERWRDARAKLDFASFLSLGLAAARVGIAGAIANVGLLASAFSFSRDQEREADDIGLRLMADAGYAPTAVPEVWEQLIAEKKVSAAQSGRNVFFASHPDPEDRLETMRRLAQERGGATGERAPERFRDRLKSLRPTLVSDELQLRQYARSEVVFDQLLTAGDDGLLWYGKGEVYRLRDDQGDMERALAAYRHAEETLGAPPELYRSIGLARLKLDDQASARRAFERYGELKPDAADREALSNLTIPNPGQRP